jgi:hypothetical protein
LACLFVEESPVTADLHSITVVALQRPINLIDI